jgi:hypothetical protein
VPICVRVRAFSLQPCMCSTANRPILWAVEVAGLVVGSLSSVGALLRGPLAESAILAPHALHVAVTVPTKLVKVGFTGCTEEKAIAASR